MNIKFLNYQDHFFWTSFSVYFSPLPAPPLVAFLAKSLVRSWSNLSLVMTH